MGRWRIIRAIIPWTCLTLATATARENDGFRHVGDYLLKSHFKITGERTIPIPIKPLAFRVFTNGVEVRVSTEGNEDAHATFEIYRSDGMTTQRSGGGALEIIPGLQATSHVDGVLRHLRLSAESMTITTFPGVSNQTIVSYSVAAEPVPQPQPPKDPPPSTPQP